jgi:hypothetical protein
MKVVAIASAKAGNGKSRFTWDLLVALVDAGINSVAFDCCPERSVSRHNTIREENNYGALPVHTAESPDELKLALSQLAREETQIALIDVPIGDPLTVIKPYLAKADVTLITAQATLSDIMLTGPLVRSLAKAGKKFRYLLVRTATGGATYDKAFLERLGMSAAEARQLLLPMSIAERPTLISDLNATGIGVIEALGNARVEQEDLGLASMELRAIRQYLRDELDF